MYNRCPHLDEGSLPIHRIKYARHYSRVGFFGVGGGGGGGVYGGTSGHLFSNFLIKLTTFLLISVLILLPRKSLAAAPKYETAYACEGKTLTIECDPGYLISLIRANYGRFSITICNDHGNVDWSVNCMSPKSLRVLHSKCTHKQNCSVLASTNMFGDPCPGTHKYLEAHYQCISAAQSSTSTSRPSPPWLITNSLSVWSTSSTAHTSTDSPSIGGNATKSGGSTTARIGSIHEMILPQKNSSSRAGDKGRPDIHLAGGQPPIVEPPYEKTGAGLISFRSTTTASTRDGVLQSKRVNNSSSISGDSNDSATNYLGNRQPPAVTLATWEIQSTEQSVIEQTQHSSSERSSSSDDTNSVHNQQFYTTQSTVLVNNYNTNNNYDSLGDGSYYCGPTTIRNLFWNVTRIGEVNVQPCPGGAFGIAKWRCVLLQIEQPPMPPNHTTAPPTTDCDSKTKNCDSQPPPQQQQQHHHNQRAGWHPQTPDLTQCRSVWINNLEISVNQRDSSLISIANDLSQITSSKTLYGGDMLVTTKIIQTMSEKMAYDVETFPDQKQREAIITELLHGVVKTGSNLLDISHEFTWLDLSFEDQMRVATSLLTGLEDNAFLLADSIIRERSVVQKVKNILLSIRVLETRNINGNEIFPDAKLEQWQVSDDRIELPRNALIENSEGGLVRIVFVAFDRLETILKPSYDHLDVKFSKNYVQQNHSKNSLQSNRILNSKVISASLGKGRHIQLSKPIRLVLRHLKTENVTNPICVFWNYIDHAWSEDGCYLEQTNHSHTICMCNHLTNFAILMDTTDETALSLLSLFDNNMRILIYISITICIIFIIIAILTLKLFNGIFIKSTRSSIYKNIYVCLFIIEILFLLGIEQCETSVLCGFTTAFLHCFILSAIAWLFFEGFQLYLTLTTDDMLLEVENTSKLIWYYLLSYGLSFTIVAISLAIDPGTYTQSDFCVLMEPNALFYTTFLAPVVLFVMGANAYSILAVYVMCKKCKTTLKNKEHTRLASVRFDLRCSFLFLIILSGGWIFAYLYLRKAKLEEDVSNTYGYLFITFNSLMGIYIFIFHCIQNEKIRREYRKYIRQNSWLPKCLRCSKTSSISSSSAAGQQQYGTAASKKSPITLPGSVGGGGGECSDHIDHTNILAATPSSSYPDQTQHTIEPIPRISNQHHHRHNILLERSSGGETLRGGSSVLSGAGGHASPTSSAGSTHLIFNSLQNDHHQSHQDWNFQVGQPAPGQYYPNKSIGGDSTAKNLNTYDDKFLNYDCKSKRLKQHPLGGGVCGTNSIRNHHSGGSSGGGALHPQHHEYFYWTEKPHHQKKKFNNGDLLKSGSQKLDSVQTLYPSYKKTRYYQPAHLQDDAKLTSASNSDFPETIADSSGHFHYPSDEDHVESHLIHSSSGIASIGGGTGTTSYRSQQQQPQLASHRRHNKHGDSSNFIGIGSMALPAIPISSGASSSSYYNHGPGMMDEPVYEEILSNRVSGMRDDDGDDDGDIGDDDDDDDDEDGGVHDRVMEEERYNRLRRMLACKDESVMGVGSLRQPFNNRRQIKPGNFDFTTPKKGGFQISPNSIKLGGGGVVGGSSDGVGAINERQTHPTHTKHVVGRNLSAMLDENNTVVCFLEPLPK